MERKTEQIKARITPENKARTIKRASQLNMKLSEYLEFLLASHVEGFVLVDNRRTNPEKD